MNDFHALHKDSAVDATDAPGQTFLSLTGEGGRMGDDGTDTELCTDREPFEAWFIVSRPPDVADFEETEYIVTRLGGNDVIPHASRNIKIQKAVRTLLGADLAKGDVALYTSNGTDEVCIRMRPGGDIDITATGNVNVGGPAADSFVARYTELKSLYDTLLTGVQAIFGAHYHLAPGGGGNTGTPLTIAGPAAFPAWDVNIASDTLKSD